MECGFPGSSLVGVFTLPVASLQVLSTLRCPLPGQPAAATVNINFLKEILEPRLPFSSLYYTLIALVPPHPDTHTHTNPFQDASPQAPKAQACEDCSLILRPPNFLWRVAPPDVQAFFWTSQTELSTASSVLCTGSSCVSLHFFFLFSLSSHSQRNLGYHICPQIRIHYCKESHNASEVCVLYLCECYGTQTPALVFPFNQHHVRTSTSSLISSAFCSLEWIYYL